MKVTVSFQQCDNYRGQIYPAIWQTVIVVSNKQKTTVWTVAKPTVRQIRRFKKLSAEWLRLSID